MPDVDGLTQTCPKCGAAAEYPDCEACGHEFDAPKADCIGATAREYVNAGLVLVPIPSGKKGPSKEGWNVRAHCWYMREAVPDEWAGNIGLAHAYSRTCALDIDSYRAALPALAQRGIDLDALLASDDAVQIRSGRPDRAKLIYRLPEGLEPLPSVDRNDSGEGFEFRCASRAGLTVQDVLPPSIHPDTGKPYEWAGNWRELPELPANVLSAWRGLLGPQRPAPAQAPKTTVAEGRHADVIRLAARVARQVVQEGLADDSGLALLTAELSRGRWSRDVTDELHRAYRDALAKCRDGTWQIGASRDVEPAQTGQPDQEQGQLISIELHDLMASAPIEPRHVVAPLIPRKVVSLLSAHGGAGKSTLGLILGAHVAAGRPWGPFECEQGNVLFVSLEDPGELVKYRLRKIVEAYSLDHRAIAQSMMIVDGTAGDGALAVEGMAQGIKGILETQAMEKVKALSAGASLVIVDNASDAFDASEIERRFVRRFMRSSLGGIARKNDAGVLLLTHIDKSAARFGSAGNSYSGSTAWHNSARSRLALLQKDDDIELVHEKANLGKKAEPLRLRWSDAGVLEPAVGSVDVGAKAAQVLVCNSDAHDVYAALVAAISKGEDVSTARAGGVTTLHVLKTYQLPSHLTKDKDRFWKAVNSLQDSGRIQVEEYLNRYRKPAKRWAIKEAA